MMRLKPGGYRMIILPMEHEKVTKGGIMLPDDTVDANRFNTSVGKVLSMGPQCFRDKNTGEPWHGGNWCEEGDWVIYPKYSPKKLEVDGQSYIILNDDEVIAVIDSPEGVKAYV